MLIQRKGIPDRGSQAITALQIKAHKFEQRRQRLLIAINAEDNAPNCRTVAQCDLEKVEAKLRKVKAELAHTNIQE
jgi:hypothetical protein